MTSKRAINLSGDGAIVVKGELIHAIGTVDKITRKYPGHRVLRIKNALLMPGLVNVHTHLEIPALLEAIRAETFPDWILNLIVAKKKLNRGKYICAAQNNVDLVIKKGTTTIGEICTHGISSNHLKHSSLRGVAFHEVISMGPSSRLPYPASFTSRRLMIQTGLSPHSPYTVSASTLQHIKRISSSNNLRFCMHVAESKEEVKLLKGRESGLGKLYQFANWDLAWAPTGPSSFEYLNRIGLLSPNLLAVHAVQVDDSDIALIKKSGVSVAHCPRSNKELGVGKMPLKKFLDAGITVGLGTDSLASVPNLNMWDEMRYAYQIHRRDGISAQDIFKLATIGGAKALGLDKETGTLEPGKKADLIAVPLPKKNTGDLYSDLLRETKSCIMTMVSGKILHRE